MESWTILLSYLHYDNVIAEQNGPGTVLVPNLPYVGTSGPHVSISSLTTSSVNITWTQPEFSLPWPVLNYTVSLTRVIGHQVICPWAMDSRLPVITMATVTSMEFTGLQEFSTYTVTVTAMFNAFCSLRQTPTSMRFTTHSAGISYINTMS